MTPCLLREAIDSAQNNMVTGGRVADSSSETDIIEINLDPPAVGEAPEIKIETAWPTISIWVRHKGILK